MTPLRVNGEHVELDVEPRRTLLDALRADLGLTGAKKSCDMGNCGACTVLLDGEAVYGWLVLAVGCAGRAATTIEGLAAGGKLHRLQEAFIAADAFQCGFCTPGQLMALAALFERTVRYVGDEVAAVAAESEELAEDAARLIEVQYEPLAFDLAGAAGEPKTEQRGDLARGLREADVVLEAVYRTQTALHNALEPHGCTALWQGERLVLYESTQGIFAVRDEV